MTRVVFLRWATASGLTARGLAVGLAAGSVLLAGLAGWAAASFDPASTGVQASLWLFGISFTGFATAAAVGIFASHFAELSYGGLQMLRTRPTGRRLVTWASRVPALLLGGCLLVVVAPASTIAVAKLSGYGALHALAGTTLVVLSGAAVGWLGHWASGLLLTGPALRSLRISLTMSTWLLLSVASVMIFAHGLRSGGAGYAPLWRTAYLVWPVALWLLLSGSAEALAATAALTAGLMWLASRTAPRPGLVTAGRARLPWRPEGPARASRLLARRMLRHPRGQEWVLLGTLGAATAVAISWGARERLAMTVDLSVLTSFSVGVAMSFSVLVRGLSSRARPLEQRIGLSATGHVLSAFSACLALGSLVVAPVAIALVLIGLPEAVVAAMVAAGFSIAVAVAASFVFAPALDAGAAELVPFIAYLGVTIAISGAANNLPDPARLLVLVVTAALALSIGVTAERRRRRLLPERNPS